MRIQKSALASVNATTVVRAANVSGAMKNWEGAFSIYANQEVKLVGYITCDGCLDSNIEYTGEKMLKTGVAVIHLAAGLVVGHPLCSYIETFKDFLEAHYDVKVVVETHPIPQKYLDVHTRLGTWDDPTWRSLTEPTISDEAIRIAYN